MMRLRTAFLAPLAFAIAVGFAFTAHASPAQDFVRAKHSNLIAELEKPASPARKKAVEAQLQGFFDFHKLTKDALAKRYDDLSEDEFNELKGLVEALVTKNYQKNIEKTINYKVTFVGEDTLSGGAERKVRTKVEKRGSDDAPVEINYVLHQNDGKWMVYDIETEGSSMLRNYRNQFGKVIRRDGFATLIRKLRDKLNET